MKKILILAAAIVACVAANAASFRWSGVNVYGAGGTSKYTGTATLYAVIGGSATEVSTAAVNAGAITATTFSNDSLVGGNVYDFYFVITDGGKSFSSAHVSATAQATSTSTIAFANQGPATQNASNWQVVPEPTSGLMLLLGVAGLALKRKRE